MKKGSEENENEDLKSFAVKGNRIEVMIEDELESREFFFFFSN